MRAGVCMWRISFWLFFSIGYIIINNSIKAGFNHYRPNRLHFLPYFNPRSPCGERQQRYTFFHAHLWREQTNTLMGPGYHCVCNTMKEAYFGFLPQKSGANLPGNSAYLGFAAKSSTYLPVDRWFYSQSVPLSSHTDFPDNKSEGCLFRDP